MPTHNERRSLFQKYLLVCAEEGAVRKATEVLTEPGEVPGVTGAKASATYYAEDERKRREARVRKEKEEEMEQIAQ